MIKFYIEYIDYDNPYSVNDIIQKYFETTKEALEYCKSMSGRVDGYCINSAVKFGQDYDWEADELLLENGGFDVGLENLKKKLTEQLQETISEIGGASSIEQLRKLKSKHYYW